MTYNYTSGLHTNDIQLHKWLTHKGHTITQVVYTQRIYNYTSCLHTNDIQLHMWFTHKGHTITQVVYNTSHIERLTMQDNIRSEQKQYFM